MSRMILTRPILSIHSYIFIQFILLNTPSQIGVPDIDSLPPVSNTLSSISISEADIYDALTSLHPAKAVGSDELEY